MFRDLWESFQQHPAQARGFSCFFLTGLNFEFFGFFFSLSIDTVDELYALIEQYK